MENALANFLRRSIALAIARIRSSTFSISRRHDDCTFTCIECGFVKSIEVQHGAGIVLAAMGAHALDCPKEIVW